MHIPFLGWEIQQIHLQFVQTLATVAGAGGLIAWLTVYWNEFWGKAMDRFVITKTLVASEEGPRIFLKFRGTDRPERITDAIRGRSNRNRMIRAARTCTLQQPFVVLGTDADQCLMHESVRNALTRLNRDGEAAELAGVKTISATIPFAVIATDEDDDPVHMFRTLVMSRDELRRYLGDTIFIAPNGKTDHPRIRSLRIMAKAYFEDHGFAVINGRRVKIVDAFELKVRA